MKSINGSRSIGLQAALVLICGLAGCGGGPVALMPSPNVYADHYLDPFVEVPPALQTNYADVIYLTDRVPDPASPKDDLWFTSERSRSVGFGISHVQFGEDLSWDDLVNSSLSRICFVLFNVMVSKTTEVGRFLPTPKSLAPHLERPTSQPATTQSTWHPPYIGAEPPDADTLAQEAAFCKMISEHLAATRVKEVYLFVHGYNNTFSDSAVTIAQLWHFFGRQGVPIAYSWPAGASGLLRGYTRDSESSEFTVYHLKQCLRLIASCPGVTKINILAHSRGTAVVTSALRELHFVMAGGGRSTRELMKLGTLVRAAPDMDVDTVIQRMVTVRLGYVPERFAMYVCKNDKALTMSNWLFEGMNRLGMLDSKMFTDEELELARKDEKVQIIEARVSDSGSFGHDYFHSNPAVSSDIILMMRYGLAPGAENGRPLRVNPHGFWLVDDTYPGPPAVDLDAKTKETP